MKFIENRLTYEEYFALRSSVGWKNFNEEQTRKSIANSMYTVKAVDNGSTIAMGRLLGDGLYYLIVDVIVMPQYQKQGIGSQIIDMLVDYVEKEMPIGGRSSIQLIAEKGKEAFNLRKGFNLFPMSTVEVG